MNDRTPRFPRWLIVVHDRHFDPMPVFLYEHEAPDLDAAIRIAQGVAVEDKLNPEEGETLHLYECRDMDALTPVAALDIDESDGREGYNRFRVVRA
jgi:hypothetical protein